MATTKTNVEFMEEIRLLKELLRECQDENTALSDRLDQIGDLASEDEEEDERDGEYEADDEPCFDEPFGDEDTTPA